jgi:hypothetical protein
MKIGDKVIDLDYPEWGVGEIVEDEDFFGVAILYPGDPYPVIYTEDHMTDVVLFSLYNSKLYKALK